MKYLWDEWHLIEPKIGQARSLFLFLDYDGTLVPIAPTPEEAVCPMGVRALLGELRDLPQIMLAIVSGRSLEDLRERVAVPGIIYVGAHGLDIQNPVGVHKKRLSPLREKELRRILGELRRSLRGIRGIRVEEKGPVVSVHYRKVSHKYFAFVHRVLQDILAHWKGQWKLAHGRMVVEIRPEVDFHKGTAVRELLRATGRDLLPIYLGDGPTDEPAFREVKNRGITILVGPRWLTSEAEFSLKSPMEVEEFLRLLADKLKVNNSCPES